MFVNGLPYLVKDTEGKGVFVEVYDVDQRTLRKIDFLEGHPVWYRRERVTVYENNGHAIECWAYVYQGKERGEYVRRF